MKEETVIILAEDDEGHASLIINSLRRTGITNSILYFKDGKETLDFLFGRGEGPHGKGDKLPFASGYPYAES